ncbi:uncharacterized protein LOC34621027 [Cyclospora cayetanensis]|uniref:Uncharacterized protein LOC34621027 n=1 Tax=Cyclospora cayetanensis TaxID=88456 RepID=A0A6P6S2I5_9EIME|nr:uncharacterized protein LOC34621027 [Cyclospora cayetanensis]
MEKYRVFADERTGCNPFVPTYYSQHQLGATFSGSPFLADCTASGRLAAGSPGPIAAATLSAVEAAASAAAVATPTHCRRLKILPRKLRPAAPFASFLALPPQTARQPAAFTGLSASRGPSPASLCLSSFTSFVEPLYLQMRLNPIFVGIHADGSLSILSFWGILKYAFSFELAAGCGQFPSLSALLLSLEGRNAGKKFIPPIVVFPEGQKSNGSCLLLWNSKGLDAAALNRLRGRVTLLGFVYSPEAVHSARKGSAEPVYTAPHTVNSPLRHLLLLLVQLRQCMRCIWVPPEDVLTCQQQQQERQQQQLLPLQHQLQPVPEQQQGELESLRCILLRAVPGLVAVNKRGQDLKAFNEYWNQQQLHRGRVKRA